MQQNSSDAIKKLDRVEMLIEYLQRELADIRDMIGIADGNLAGSREKAEDVAQRKLGISIEEVTIQAKENAQRMAEVHRGMVDPPTRTVTSDPPPPTQQEMDEATRRASEPDPGTAARERQAKKQPLPFGGAK